ncbi:hypothetical protein K2X96_02395 [Patescibacteria group bacterium]|jgi:hypothetical protein|nr:hypothetical protein [Patescibacteria group bacterium]
MRYEEYIGDLSPTSENTGRLREISWEAPEHHHTEKGSDWYWALGIITIAGAITTIIFGNVLFGVVILLAGLMTALISSRPPRTVTYSISVRGIRIGTELYPYSSLTCFYINEEHHHHLQLLIQTTSFFTPLLVIPMPDEALEDVEEILEPRLPEKYLEESLGQRILEFLGF